MNKKTKTLVLGLGVVSMSLVFYFSQAAWLSPISDTITNSAPNASSDHLIEFTVLNQIPAGGKIIITPQPGVFNIPTAVNFRDIDFIVDGLQRDLAAFPGFSEDGVSVVAGSNGSITITLRNSSGIQAGRPVDILIGESASHGDTGDAGITNPSSTGSYEVSVETQSSSGTKIDGANTEIAIVDPITNGPVEFIDQTPPIRTNGLPAGELPAGVTNVEISLETDDLATCKYSLAADTLYDDMANDISSAFGRFHSVEVDTEDGQEYTFYIRCENIHGFENTDDFIITFSIKETPEEGSEPGEEGGEDVPATGGTGSGSGEAFPPVTASATFTGRAYPQSTVYILQDGVIVQEAQATVNGGFSVTISDLEKGVRTFGVYAEDSSGKKSSTVTSTFAVQPNTNTTIAGMFLSPTMQVSATEIEPGDAFAVSGSSFPNSEVEVLIYEKGSAQSSATTFKTDVSSNGSWDIEIDSGEFDNGNYYVRAQSMLVGGTEISELTNRTEIGIGAGVEAGLTADLNVDGKVNIIDFSILLFHWSTSGGDSDPPADINQNTRVDLADFSIMLFNWTG